MVCFFKHLNICDRINQTAEVFLSRSSSSYKSDFDKAPDFAEPPSAYTSAFSSSPS